MGSLLMRHAAKLLWAAALLRPTAAWGVEYGWQPVAGGGIEYIIQIEPEMLDALKEGDDIFSDLPPATANIRGYRITVGTGNLPHQGEPLPVETPDERTLSSKTAAGFESPLPAGFDHPLPGPELNSVQSSRGRPREFLPASARGASRLVGNPSGPKLGGPANAKTDEPAESDDEAAESSGAETDPPAQSSALTGGSNPGGAAAVSDNETPDADRGAKPASSLAESGKSLSLQAVAQDRKSKKSGENKAEQSRSDERSASDEPESTIQDTGDGAGSLADPKPWLPLSLTLLGLFASLGANVYLVWIASGLRRRYRSVIHQTQPEVRHQEQVGEPADPWEPDWERIYSEPKAE